MTNIEINLLTKDNFSADSLDDFVRTQPVEEVYRKVNGEYILVQLPFTDDWTSKRKREKAQAILSEQYSTYGAFLDGHIVGFIMVEKETRGNSLVIDSFHVDKRFRRMGIGKKLFRYAENQARDLGAKQLYISACSSKETISFYMALGCFIAPQNDVIMELAEDEPFDLQLIYPIELTNA
ncbi:MAG: GNAT family N-acetyltransferase [Clostridia bacterium]|nr:GNAT family N-acetyltransferase [Clostridia bacterium]